MEKPQFAPASFRSIIMSCWNEKPKERPTFLALEKAIGNLMDPHIRAQYAKAYDEFGYIRFNEDEDPSLMSDNYSDEFNVSSVEYLELTKDDNNAETDYRISVPAISTNC